jgi:hypothetical protein
MGHHHGTHGALRRTPVHRGPKRVARDVEFTPDGQVLLSNTRFPSWHFEDAQPTLIRLNPNARK